MGLNFAIFRRKYYLFQIRSGPLKKGTRTILKAAFWHFRVTFPPRFEGRRVGSLPFRTHSQQRARASRGQQTFTIRTEGGIVEYRCPLRKRNEKNTTRRRVKDVADWKLETVHYGGAFFCTLTTPNRFADAPSPRTSMESSATRVESSAQATTNARRRRIRPRWSMRALYSSR